MKSQQTLLFITAGSLTSSQVRFAGISRYAMGRGWVVQAVEHADVDTPFEDLMRFWNPLGVILEYGEDLPRDAVRHFRRVPVVCLDRDPDWGGTCVCQDSREAGVLIARELLRSGDRKSFGYVEFTSPKRWDAERRAGFEDMLAVHGKTCSVFRSSKCRERDLLNNVGEWLKALPRPCGIMASADVMSAKVLGVCMRIGLSVPDEVSIAGVDDVETICENSSVTLTSVQPDFEGSGFVAAELVDRMRNGEKGGNRVVRFPERRLVRRASTTVLKRKDGAILKALDYIRTNAASGVCVNDVVAVIGSSRRSAEMRFRSAFGTSIFEAIDAVRVERAKELLANPRQAIGPVAGLCGFGTEANFRRAFRTATGASPRAWRERTR